MRTEKRLALGVGLVVGAMWSARQWLRAKRWIELRDRVVVITGSDSGFGLVQARQAAQQGAILVLASRNVEKLESAAEAVRKEGAREVIAAPTDVSDPRQAQELIDLTVERFGRIDVLINTAGLMLVGAEPTITLDDMRTLMDVNFWALCTRQGLPCPT